MPKVLNVGSLYLGSQGPFFFFFLDPRGITVEVDEIHIMKNINCLWDVMILGMSDKGKSFLLN